MFTDEQRARMNRLFWRNLQAEKGEGRERAWIQRGEIVAEGEAMGLTEEQSLKLAQIELARNWVVLDGVCSHERGFMGAVFTDVPGVY